MDVLELLKIKTDVNDSMLFNAYVSGSHLYGWNSDDSDIDIRGVFVKENKWFLGLKKHKEVIHPKFDDPKRKALYDIELFEIRKMIELALKGNCNMLEELSAHQIYAEPEFYDLRSMLLDSYGKKGLYGSYYGMAKFNYKKFIRAGRNTVKKYLYVFRALMGGIWALKNGTIQPNILILNEYFDDELVADLIERKLNGTENMPIPPYMKGKLNLHIKGYFNWIGNEYHDSELPKNPNERDIKKINNWLVKFRKENICEHV